MPTITVQATTPLTPFAKENLTRLSFDSSKPETLPEQVFKPKHVSWLGKKVAQIDPKTTAGNIAYWAIVALIAISIIGIPLIIFLQREMTKYERNGVEIEYIQRELDEKVRLINRKAWFIEKLGLENFARIPERSLTTPLNKGIGPDGDPFITLKLVGSSNAKPFDLQLRMGEYHWEWHTENREFFLSKILNYRNFCRFDENFAFNFAFLRQVIAGESVQGYRLAS